MPSYTISGSNGGDSLHCLGTVFADVCAGSGAGVTGFDTATANSQADRFPGLGNDTDGTIAGCDPAAYNIGLWFISFDTSGISSGEIVTSVTFRAFASNRLFGGSNWQYELYAVDFGATIGAEDWLTPDALSGMTLLASWPASAHSGNGVYYEFTSQAAFPAAIVKGGTTRLVMASSFHRTATQPPAEEWYFVAWSGASDPPQLLIETEAASDEFEATITQALPLLSQQASGTSEKPQFEAAITQALPFPGQSLVGSTSTFIANITQALPFLRQRLTNIPTVTKADAPLTWPLTGPLSWPLADFHHIQR